MSQIAISGFMKLTNVEKLTMDKINKKIEIKSVVVIILSLAFSIIAGGCRETHCLAGQYY